VPDTEAEPPVRVDEARVCPKLIAEAVGHCVTVRTGRHVSDTPQIWPELQSPLTKQPPAGSQTPEALQAPDRQTTPPLLELQAPSPFAYPHSLSLVSQTPEAQTRAAAEAVQAPVSVGLLCCGSVGSAVPFGSLAVQVSMASSHQCPAVQSPSTRQAPGLGGKQLPLTLQTPLLQTVAPLLGVQGPSPTT
jgi:hypothetical protein